jgi:hypothetical protein
MKSEHTGIFERTIRETPDEWFHGFLGSVNSGLAVAEYTKRARETFRKVFNLPEDTPTKIVIVPCDSSWRPLTETQERDKNWNVLENLSHRDLRNNPIAEYVRELLFAAEVFRLTREKRQTLRELLEVGKLRKVRRVELLRELAWLSENLQSLAMHIAALDLKIAVAPYEPITQYGKKRLQDVERMRRELKKRKDAKKTLWKGKLRRLIRQHKGWTNYAIATEALKNPPEPLKRGGLSTLLRYLDEIR